jgi:class 3 adenylate cyclase
MKRHLPDRLIVAVIVALGLTFLVSMLEQWSGFADLTAWSYDFLVNHGRYAPVSKDIVFVDFDDATFAKINKFPIPRSTVADLIERVGKAGPAVIGLDILLSEPRDAEEDAAMQRALTSAGNVVVAAQAGTGQIPAVMPMPMFCQPEKPELATGFCVEGRPGAFAYAAVNMPFDTDGYVRDAESVTWGKKIAESFPVFLAEQYLAQVDPNCRNCTLQPLNKGNLQFRGYLVPLDDRETWTFRIGDWSLHPAVHISAWDVLTGVTPPAQFHNRLILIGQGSDAARDRDFSPLYRTMQPNGKRQQIAGTELHAAAIETLLNGHAIGEVPVRIRWCVNFILIAAATWVFTRARLSGAFGLTVVFMLAIYAPTQILFTWYHLWFPNLETLIGVAAALPCGVGWQYVKANLLRSETEQQRKQLMEMFSRYVDPAVANAIWDRRDEVSLEGDERVATVLFSDIRNFTGITAGKPSKIVLKWLNRYFTAMDEVIRAHDGFLNKFIGDGLLVVYGVPLSQGETGDAVNAVNSALAMLKRVEQFNAERAEDEDFPDIRIGVGVHTGMLTSGSVGSLNRLEYSVIGETVNLASRLESLNKEFGTEIILSQGTYERVKDTMPGIFPLGATQVRGFDEEIMIYGIGPRKKAKSSKAEVDQPEILA